MKKHSEELRSMGVIFQVFDIMKQDLKEELKRR